MSYYPKSFTSFSGADVITFINGKPMGEIAEVRWRKNLNRMKGPESVEGVIKAAVFGECMVLDGYEGKTFDIVMKYLNEEGDSKVISIEEVKLEEVEGGISVDEMVEEVEYKFRASKVVQLPYHVGSEQKLEYIRLGKNEKLIQLYKDEMVGSLIEKENVIVSNYEVALLKKKAEEYDRFRRGIGEMEKNNK